MLVVAACVLFSSAARSDDPAPAAPTVDWKACATKGRVSNGEVIELTEQRPFTAAHAVRVIKLAGKQAEPTQHPAIELTTIEDPPITKQYFALNGWVQHQGVEGTGYLEMWVLFADGSHYFSRTLEITGPLQSLSGASEWRKFSIPFQLSDDPKAAKPNKLIVNAVLPGAGEITLSDVTLTEADDFAAAITSDTASLTIDWKARAAEGLVSNGEAIDLTDERPFEAAHALKVVSPAKPGETVIAEPVIRLTTIDNPPITKQSFALNGWIRHQGVEGTGYLEMWVLFADGSHYFSRTLAEVGPMKSLSGDSEWREIVLPFQLSADPKAAKPNQLIVNLVLPGAGDVTLSDLTLTEADNTTAALIPSANQSPIADQAPLETVSATTSRAWWSDRTSAWVGSLGGSAIGLMGAVIGTLAGLGIGRRFIAPLLIAGIALGAVMLVAGIVSLTLGQPYAVYYPLFLGGVLCTLLGTVGLVVTRQRFAEIELRRMQALDA